MDKYKKYYGVITFCILVCMLMGISYSSLAPLIKKTNDVKAEIVIKNQKKDALNKKLRIVQAKIKKIKDAILSSQKKIYSPTESDLGNDTLFFTLYNDVIEMLRSNYVKIKTIKYVYNPESDAFVRYGKDVYFVCDVDMELISNYYNLGKFIEDIYKYNYYIRINELEVSPYKKDKKILLSKVSLRLYAHTAPDLADDVNVEQVDKILTKTK